MFSLQGGFLPNVFKALSHRPAEFRAFFAYYNELMGKETGVCFCCMCLCIESKCKWFCLGAMLEIVGQWPGKGNQTNLPRS